MCCAEPLAIVHSIHLFNPQLLNIDVDLWIEGDKGLQHVKKVIISHRIPNISYYHLLEGYGKRNKMTDAANASFMCKCFYFKKQEEKYCSLIYRVIIAHSISMTI